MKITTLAAAAALALSSFAANAQSTNAPGASTVGGEANPQSKSSSTTGGSSSQTGAGMSNATGMSTGSGMSNSNMGTPAANPPSQGKGAPSTK